MAPRTKTLILIVLAVFGGLLMLAALGAEDDDQGPLWRGVSAVLRLLTLIGRLF